MVTEHEGRNTEIQNIFLRQDKGKSTHETNITSLKPSEWLTVATKQLSAMFVYCTPTGLWGLWEFERPGETGD